MNNEQILEKAIDKAVRNGWLYTNHYKKLKMGTRIDKTLGRIFDEYEPTEPEQYIFSHDFAKAFWGEGKVCRSCGDSEGIKTFCTECGLGRDYWEGDASGAILVDVPKWQYHLQQMVLEEDPIKYLKEFL